MRMWIARTDDNELYIFREKPFKMVTPETRRTIWVYDSIGRDGFVFRRVGEMLDPNDFPEVTFENSPMEVELIIKR